MLEQDKEIAIMILSCDKFKITWKPCIDHLVNVWPDCPYDIYLLNNNDPVKDDRVKDLLVGPDNNWSDTLANGLDKIDAKRIFFIFDDTFITRIDVPAIEHIFEQAIDNDLASVALLRKRYNRGVKFSDDLYRLSSATEYRNSLFLNLIKRDVVLEILKSGENAWEFEKIGNKRSEGFEFYSVFRYDIVDYYHGIIKGKWLPKTYQYLIDKNYDLNKNTFDIYNNRDVYWMKVYERLFNITKKILHTFK